MTALRFLGITTCVATLAMSPEAQPTTRFDHFGTTHGLSQSIVTAIAQDHQGYLWVGTDDGLNRFDGRTFTVYRHALEDSTTLPGSRITSLYVDGHGDLWVGTMRGLARFDRRTETFRIPPGAPGDPRSRCASDVTSIAPSPAGHLWMGTFSGGLCVLSPDRRSARRVRIEASDGRPVDRVYALRADIDGVPWAQVATLPEEPRPLCRTDDATRSCQFLSETVFVRPIPGSEDLVTVGPSAPLTIARTGSAGRGVTPLHSLDMKQSSASRQQNILTAPSGVIWTATEDDGILTIDPDTGERRSILPDADDPRSLASSTVRVLFEDRQGIIWVGTAQGLSRWRPPAPGHFRVVQRGPPASGGLSDARVNGIAETRDGAIWVGTRDGLNRIDPVTGRVDVLRRPDDEAYANAYWYLHEAPDGTLWVGSKRRGLWRVRAGRRELERVPFYAGPTRPVDPTFVQTRHIMTDSKERVWVGFSTGFSVRLPDGRWHTWFTADFDAAPLPSPRVNLFFEDRLGRIWVGTDGGLCRLAPEAAIPDDLRFTCYRHAPGDPTTIGANVVWTMTEDGQGRIWVGTVGGGLARYVPETDAFERLTTRDGLPNNTIYGLVTDRTGALWATTNAGLARIDPASGEVAVYTTDDGLPGDEFDLMAYAIGRSGTIHVGGPNGLVSFDPEAMLASALPAEVVVTGAHVFDRPLPGLFAAGDTLRLRHDENFFRLAFSTLDLRTPERTRFRYRLAGYEGEWRHTSGEAPEASYTGVPPGRYVFEVVASGGDSRFGDAPTRLHVVVVPALWQTTGFRSGIALLVLLGVGLGLASVQRRRRDERARREADAAELKRRVADARDRERVRLARELHDGPVQDLYRLGHDLDRLRLRSGTEPPGPSTLMASRAQVTTVATNLREVLATLRPPIVPHLGLGAALDALARRWRRRSPGLDVRLALDDSAARALSPEAQNALYRVAQEALTNVQKHADTLAAEITLGRASGGIEMAVRDAGRGFEKPGHLLDLARADHFGLVGAAERLDVLGGRLSVDTAPGAGTTVRAWVPEQAQPTSKWPNDPGPGGLSERS